MPGIPGYVDLQVNGYMGVDFSSPELTGDDFIRVSVELLKSGTAVFLPTLITSSMKLYRRNLDVIMDAIDREGLEAHLPGVHLEGPFLSPGAMGCHDPALMLEPRTELLDELAVLCRGRLKLLTVAGELPGMPEFIHHAASRGICLSLGHHLANASQIASCAAAGARALTHLGNGLPSMLPRHDNPIWNGLACDDLSAMLITDGHHLTPELIKCALRIKGVDKVIVVSDASPAAGLPPGKYQFLGVDAVLEPNGKFHCPERGCLAGSGVTMKQCMDYLSSLHLLSAAELEQVGYYNPLRLIGMIP